MTGVAFSPWSIARAVWRGLVLAFALVGALLRRLPGAGLIERFASLLEGLLLVAAFLAFIAWAGTAAPQRISLAQLAAGELSPMQSWIIVSGDVHRLDFTGEGYLYLLTDPAAPNTALRISTAALLDEGEATVSGDFSGGDNSAQPGFPWRGFMRADPALAAELGPPWAAIGLALGAVLLWLLSRTSYPVLFVEEPRPTSALARRLDVTVRRDWPPIGASTPGALDLEPGMSPQVRVSDGETRQLSVHSIKASIEVARLQWLSTFEPVLVVRAPGGEVTLGFASRDDRDGAYAALVAASVKA